MDELTVREVRVELLNAAERLARERSDLPTGTVLRCFSVAVQAARRAGCEVAVLPVAAESMARILLTGRRPAPDSVPRRRARAYRRAPAYRRNRDAGPVAPCAADAFVG